MQTINVKASKNYDVIISEGILSRSGNITKEKLGQFAKVAIITDSNVAPLYFDTVANSYKSKSTKVFRYIFKAGESAKSIENVMGIINWLIDNSFTRNDLVVALGGGVCGDLAGFVASIYLRGISFIQIPTTFLAAIDSSVGGKTAVNIPAGKNLVGTFWQPSLVLCDIKTFDTLSPSILSEGTAEAIKYGCIWDKALFNSFKEKDWQDNISEIVKTCVNIKAEIVAIDERESGLRQILNFGHSIAHAIEKLSNLKISHGNAVAIGMVFVTRSTEKSGLTKKGTTKSIVSLLEKHELPTTTDFSAEELATACLSDKKRQGNSINFVTIKAIGEYEITNISNDILADFIRRGLL